MTPEEAKGYDGQPTCVHCGGYHLRACPRVKRLAFNADGAVTEVEFWPPGQWPERDVVWPEDVHGALADED